MPRHCCVPKCSSNMKNDIAKNGPVSVFLFPKDDALQKEWVKCIRRDDWKPSKYSAVCEKHF